MSSEQPIQPYPLYGSEPHQNGNTNDHQQQQPQRQQQEAEPPQDIESRLAQLDDLLARGVITDNEHAVARQAAINSSAVGSPQTNNNNGARNNNDETTNIGGLQCRCIEGQKLTSVVFSKMKQQRGELRMPPCCTICMVRFKEGEVVRTCDRCGICVCARCAAEERYRKAVPLTYTGLCGCFSAGDFGTFLEAIFCYYCFIAKMGFAMNQGYSEDPDPLNGNPAPGVPEGCTASVCCHSVLLMFCDLICLTNNSCMNICGQRMLLTQRYMLVDDNNGCAICAKAFFCRCCLLAANHREMTARGQFPGGICCSAKPNRKVLNLRPPCEVVMLP